MELPDHMKIRQRVLSIFNRRRQDFETDREYDDYLEDVEDIIFNLTEKKNVADTERRITIYEAANRDNIIANRVREAEEAKGRAEAAARAVAAEQLAAQQAADQISAQAPSEAGQRGAGVAGAPATAAAHNVAAPAFTFAMDPRQQMVAQPLPVGGEHHPHHPNGGATTETEARENEQKAALASGYPPEVPKHRALQEALSSLFL